MGKKAPRTGGRGGKLGSIENGANSVRSGVEKALRAYRQHEKQKEKVKRRRQREESNAAAKLDQIARAVDDLHLIEDTHDIQGLLESNDSFEGERRGDASSKPKPTLEEAGNFLFRTRGPMLSMQSDSESSMVINLRSLWGGGSSTYTNHLPSIHLPSASVAENSYISHSKHDSNSPGRSRNQSPSPKTEGRVRPAAHTQPTSPKPKRPQQPTTNAESPRIPRFLRKRNSQDDEDNNRDTDASPISRRPRKSFIMGGSNRKFSSVTGSYHSSSTFSRVDVQLTRMHHSTLLDEITRLVQENAKFAKSLATIEDTINKQQEQLAVVSLEFSQNTEEFERDQLETQRATERVAHIREQLQTVHSNCDLNRFRERQLNRMLFRSQDERNVAKNQMENLQNLMDAQGVQQEMRELQLKYKEAQQIVEALQAKRVALEEKQKIYREAFKSKFTERAQILSEVQQLRILQIDTALRRKEIAMLAQGDVSKRQERKLKQTSLINAKRKTATEGVLANMKCSVSRYEKTIRKIQQSTGIWDVNTVVDRFFSQESKRTHLEKELVECNERRKELEQRLVQATSQLLHAREYGVDSSGQNVADLSEIEGRVAESSARMRHIQADFRDTYRLILSLVEGSLTLARGLYITIPPELQSVLDPEALDAPTYTANYGKVAKTLLAELLGRLVYILNFAPSCQDLAGETSVEIGGTPSKSRIRRKGSNSSHVPVRPHELIPISPMSPSAGSGHKSPIPRSASPAELATLQQMEKSLNSILQSPPTASALTHDSNIRVKPRRDSVPQPTIVQSAPQRLTIPQAREREHQRKQTLNKMLKSMVDPRNKRSTSPADSQSDEGADSEVEMYSEKHDISEDVTKRKSQASIPSQDGILETEEDTCFAFLHGNTSVQCDDVARAVTRNLRRRQSTGSSDDNNETLQHNRVLFNLLGHRRSDYGQPEAISAQDLYNEVLRKDMKVPCFSRDDIKLLSKHLVKQDKQAQNLVANKSFSRDFNRKQSTLTRLRSNRSSKFTVFSDIQGPGQAKFKSSMSSIVPENE